MRASSKIALSLFLVVLLSIAFNVALLKAEYPRNDKGAARGISKYSYDLRLSDPKAVTDSCENSPITDCYLEASLTRPPVDALWSDHVQPPKHYKTLEMMLADAELDNSSPDQLRSMVPTGGTRELLVLLVELSGVAPDEEHTTGYYDERFFADTSPSVHDYYLEVSYGIFTYVRGAVMGWYPSTYTQSQWLYNTVAQRAMVAEAITDVDPYFDFSSYDADADGIVSNEELTLFVIVSGNQGGAFHWWTIGSVATGDGVAVEGEFSVANEDELLGNCCHELGHDLGLPDLYDTSDDPYDSYGIGDYGLMGSGSWIFAHPTAWCKIQLGWITPFVVTASGYYDVHDSETNAEAYVLADPTHPNEYFLVENKCPTNSYYETFGSVYGPYPDEGIVIYHIDETRMEGWINSGNNNVNADEAHKGVDVECADLPSSHFINADDLDSKNNYGDTSDLWDIDAYDFSDTSIPCNASWYSDDPSGMAVSEFPVAGSTMTVYLSVSPAQWGGILVVEDDDGSNIQGGSTTSLAQFEYALTNADYEYTVWTESSMGHPQLQYLRMFKLVIWTCGDYWNGAVDSYDAAILEDYVSSGGNLILEGEDIAYDHGEDDFMVNVAHALNQTDQTGSSGLTVTDPDHPVTAGLPSSFTWASGEAPPFDDGVSPANGGVEVIRYTGTSWSAVTVFNGVSEGSVVYYSFPLYSLEPSEAETLTNNSVRWLLPLALAFDFGQVDSSVAVGYTRVTNLTAYSASIGYGWSETDNLWTRDRAAPDSLRRDFVVGNATGGSIFNIDVPDGVYIVTVITGDQGYAHDNLDVYVEGALVINDATSSAGSFRELSFKVAVLDQQLNLRFVDDGGTDPNWVLNALEVEVAPPLPSEASFDFGTSGSPVQAGHVQVSPSTAYSVASGYGWSSTVGLDSRDRGSPDDLTRDLVFGSTEHVFNVDVANDEYMVTVTIGDWNFMHDMINVYAEGTLVANHLTVPAGTFQTLSFRVLVTDEQLNIGIQDDEGVDPYWVLNALSIVVASPLPTEALFDFGMLGSPVESGYAQVSTSSAYSAATGYGWSSTVGLDSRDRGSPDDLRRDFVFGSAERAFNVDLANGDYLVTVIIGDQAFRHDNIDVYAEDNLVIDDLTAVAGSFQEVSVRVSVVDAQLNLRISDDGGVDPYWVLTALTVEVASPLPTEALFDFGMSGSPVESGYVQVSPSTVYSALYGYGWSSTSGLDSRDRGAPDYLRRDLIFSSSENTFNVDIANGDYLVSVLIGDQGFSHDLIDVYAEDALKVDDLTATAGSFEEVSFVVAITDEQLNLRILDDGGTDPNWVINSLTVEPSYGFAPVGSQSDDYRWLDVADQAYSGEFQGNYEYPQAAVYVSYATVGESLMGKLVAQNLKPNFAYQLKLVGTPGTESNEFIGLAGRWWEQVWAGSSWSGGSNLNDKGNGSSPNPNDLDYFARYDIEDATSDTGFHYKYTGYLLLAYFITDSEGAVVLDFETGSSYHVLWNTDQRAPVADDGPLVTVTFDPAGSEPAYDVDYESQTISVFGEWERLPMGSVDLTPGDYDCQLVLTEESFHGTDPLSGNWAAALAVDLSFTIV